MDEHVRAGDRLAPLRLIPAETKVRFGWVLLCATLGLLAGGCDGATDGLKGAADGGDKECIPQTCRDLDFACGTFDDGCGGRVNCEESCGCTEENFREVCPDRPCEIVFGCFSGQCAYRPVTCDDEDCLARPCEGEGCELICSQQGCDEGLYPCSQSQRVCAGVRRYCDPAPRLVGGQILYQNECIPAPKRGCGTCELGAVVCDEENDGFICEEAPLPAGTSCSEDFIYVDPTYSEGRSDGSKAKPFVKYEQALATAEATGTSVIIIGGSPTFTQRLEIKDGISVYGGFTTHPEFKPDPSARPVWKIAATPSNWDAVNARLVGMIARDIQTPTIVRGIRVETESAGALRDVDGNGASNIAALVAESRRLSLINLELSAGHAAHGADGSVGGIGMKGGNAVGQSPGEPDPSCPGNCTAAVQPTHAGVDTRCGAGAPRDIPSYVTSENSSDGGERLPGNSGHSAGSVGVASGGAGGKNPCDQPWCLPGNDPYLIFVPGTPGGEGSPGASGSPGTRGADASRATFNAEGVWRSAPPASAGGVGTRGTWGGGGGAGGATGGSNQPLYGGAGGGGGAPGCGGKGGEGGKTGGASVALLIASSSDIAVHGSFLQSGSAGRGGAGGQGGEGGDGGDGADGGYGDSGEGSPPGPHPYCMDTQGSPCPKKGGKGGKGGQGGRGGRGGSGSGGDSNAIRCVNSTDLALGENELRLGLEGAAGAGALDPEAIRGEANAIEGCD